MPPCDRLPGWATVIDSTIWRVRCIPHVWYDADRCTQARFFTLSRSPSPLPSHVSHAETDYRRTGVIKRYETINGVNPAVRVVVRMCVDTVSRTTYKHDRPNLTGTLIVVKRACDRGHGLNLGAFIYRMIREIPERRRPSPVCRSDRTDVCTCVGQGKTDD